MSDLTEKQISEMLADTYNLQDMANEIAQKIVVIQKKDKNSLKIHDCIDWFTNTRNEKSRKALEKILDVKLPKTQSETKRFLRAYVGLEVNNTNYLTESQIIKIVKENIGRQVYLIHGKRYFFEIRKKEKEKVYDGEWLRGIPHIPNQKFNLHFIKAIGNKYIFYGEEHLRNLYELHIDDVFDIIVDDKSAANNPIIQKAWDRVGRHNAQEIDIFGQITKINSIEFWDNTNFLPESGRDNLVQVLFDTNDAAELPKLFVPNIIKNSNSPTINIGFITDRFTDLNYMQNQLRPMLEEYVLGTNYHIKANEGRAGREFPFSLIQNTKEYPDFSEILPILAEHSKFFQILQTV